MIKLNPYLNFLGQTEEAFSFYRSVFGGEFSMIQRFREVPDLPDRDKISEADLEKIMHISLPIGNEVLMGTDAIESRGETLTVGNNVSLSLSVDSREEADRLFNALKAKGSVALPMGDMFWGAYFGMVDDQYGIKWMIGHQSDRTKEA